MAMCGVVGPHDSGIVSKAFDWSSQPFGGEDAGVSGTGRSEVTLRSDGPSKAVPWEVAEPAHEATEAVRLDAMPLPEQQLVPRRMRRKQPCPDWARSQASERVEAGAIWE